MTEHRRLKRPPGALNRKPAREPDLPLDFGYEQPPDRASAWAADEAFTEHRDSTWRIRTPVFQWEIDPTDPERRCGTAEIRYLGWDFRMWWEKHPVGLVYATIQATEGSRERDWEGAWASPPLHSLVATLVYDEQRMGIVSIQGDTPNLHPFIEAFLMGFGVGPSF